MVLVGIDIGATKTHIALIRGDKIADHLLPTNDWRPHRLAEDARSLARLIHEITAGETPSVVVIGAHGCDSMAECMAFQAQFDSLMNSTVLVVNDAELLVPATGQDRGISVVAGTGSIAVSRLADGTMLVAGGWGWLLGDEGGAVGLVREALRTVRSALDSGETSDPLIETMKRAFDTEDPIHFGRKLLEAGDAAAVGQHVPAVFAAAEEGSDLARTVIADGGQALAILVRKLVNRGATGGLVATAGGVIARQPMLLDEFRKALATSVPDWQLKLLTEPPVYGALALARTIESGGVPFGHGPDLLRRRVATVPST